MLQTALFNNKGEMWLMCQQPTMCRGRPQNEPNESGLSAIAGGGGVAVAALIK